MTDIKDEKSIDKYPKPVTIDGTKEILNQMEKCICKISNKKGNGTGFFCLIPYKKKKLQVMITCNHIIDEEILKNNKFIEVSLSNNEKKIIKLENKKIYTSKIYDTTIIEIDSKNEIIEKYLELDEKIFDENQSTMLNKNESIYILHYPEFIYEQNLCVSYGIVSNIQREFMINHCCFTNPGSSGSPILKISNNKIIGIHKGSCIKNDENAGYLLKYSINEYINDMIINEMKSNNKKNYLDKNNYNLIKENDNFEKKEYLNNKIIYYNIESELNNKIKKIDDVKESYEHLKDLNINYQIDMNNKMNNFNLNNMNMNNKNYMNYTNNKSETDIFKDDRKDPKDIIIIYKELDGDKLLVLKTSLGLKINMYVKNNITINELYKTFLKEVGLEENFVEKVLFLYNGKKLDFYSKEKFYTYFKNSSPHIIVFDPEDLIINIPLNITFIVPYGLNTKIKASENITVNDLLNMYINKES